MKRDDHPLHDYWPLRLHDSEFWHSSRSDSFLAGIAIHRLSASKQRGVLWRYSVRRPAAAKQISLESSRFRWSLYTGSDAAIDLMSLATTVHQQLRDLPKDL
jgi:hypothetical protein